MFETARETLRRGLARFRNRAFLDAVMAAAALVATADGEVTFSELSKLDDVLENVQDLQIYDPHVAVDLYRDYADAIMEDRDRGRRDAFERVSRISGNDEEASLLVRVALAISRADGEFTSTERQTVSELCGVLGLPLPDDSRR
jgi:tellurite resistance protein TerB